MARRRSASCRSSRSCPTEQLAAEGSFHTLRINRLMVDGVVETPNGAHFTECVPDYAATRRSRRSTRRRRRRAEAWDAFRAKYLDVATRPTTSEVIGATAMTAATRAEVCVVAVAECFRGDGEILANPIGTIPMIGGRLAAATFEPAGDDRRRGAARRNPCRSACPSREGGRGVEPVPHDVRRGVVRPAPRDDGRQPDRPLRQPELRVHRRLAQAQGAAARLPRRAGQHDQRHDHLLDPEPLAQAVRRRRRRRDAASATTGPRSSGRWRRGSTRSAAS